MGATFYYLNSLKECLASLSCCGFEDAELGVFMDPEVDHGMAEVYATVEA